MKSRHCDEGSNHIKLIDYDYKIASFLAMTERQYKPRVIGRLFEIIGYSGSVTYDVVLMILFLGSCIL